MMLESRSYRETLYAKYVTVQIPRWLQASEKQNQSGQRAIAGRLHGWLPATKNVCCLDLGCGAGDQLMALKSLGFANLIGVDIGREQVTIAQNRGLCVVRADLLVYLNTCEQAFDLIFAYDIIEHFTKDEVLELLRLTWERLKPGGCLILQTPNAMSPWASHYRYDDLTHEHIFSPKCIVSTLQLTGFTDITVREVGPYVHGFRSVVRHILWKVIWGVCAAWNYIESGASQGGVYTRNMLVRAVKAHTP
jgi:cyclopropane fatty-acyl-phospholipid synthase-like methyltransferase